MDFNRSELCNPNIVTISRYAVVDAIDPFFDADNDILFSKNGLIISFPKPIENYRWVELELENVGFPVTNLTVTAVSNSNESAALNSQRSLNLATLNQLARKIIKLPNIGRVEQIQLNGQFQVGNYIAIKSIRVVLNHENFQLGHSAAIVPVVPLWTYDAINDWYYKDFAAASGDIPSVNVAFTKAADYLNVHWWTFIDDPFQIPFLDVEGKNINTTGRDISMDISGDPLKQVWPLNLQIVGPINGGRVYLQFKYGSFPTTAISAFAAPAGAGTPVAPGASGLVGNGYVKLAAGLFAIAATIPVGDISGAGNILTHNVAEFAQVANNLSDLANVVTARTNLGLGTAAVLPSTTWLTVANNLSDLANAGTARANLGLGTAAVLPSTTWLTVANNLSDLNNAGTARTNLGLGTIATQSAAAVAITGGTINGTTLGATTPASGIFTTLQTTNTTNSLYSAGCVGIFDSTPHTNASILSVGGNVIHPSTATTIYGDRLNYVGTATTTGTMYGYNAILSSTATAITTTNVNFFTAQTLIRAGASVITNARGFYAAGGLAGAATNTYGFYSDINSATATYQLYMAGTATSYFAAGLGIGTTNPGTGGALIINPVASLVNASIANIQNAGACFSTTTANFIGVESLLSTPNLSFTLSNLIHFYAETTAKGAANTLTNSYGFYASNGIVAATNNYGFYSNIAAATNTFQLSMQGTAKSRFGGPVYHAQDNSTTQAVSALFQGTGVPSNANGNDGDFYLRGDTPGTANQRLYVKSAGAWVGIV